LATLDDDGRVRDRHLQLGGATDLVAGESHLTAEVSGAVGRVPVAPAVAEDVAAGGLAGRCRDGHRAMGDAAGDVAPEGLLDAPGEAAGSAGGVDDGAHAGAGLEATAGDGRGGTLHHRVR